MHHKDDTSLSISAGFFKEKPYLKPRARSELTGVKTSKNFLKGVNHLNEIKKVKKKMPKELRQQDQPIPQRYKYNWFLKMNRADESITEVIAQELFRLFIPNQPKTRLVQDIKPKDEGTYLYIMSKEIPEYNTFKKIGSKALLENFKNGTYYGLGDVLIFALLLNETDLKEDNIGVNAQGQVLKIDGGKCFAEIEFEDEERNYAITEGDLKSLPKVSSYEAHNWLDQLGYSPTFGTYHLKSIWDSYDFSKHPGFQKEINQALLRAILMPEEVIRKCIQDCIPQDLRKTVDFEHNSDIYYLDIKEAMDIFTDLVLNRQAQLKSAALKRPGFRCFLQSKVAEDYLQEYLDYLSTYTTIFHNGLNIEKLNLKFTSELRYQRIQVKREQNHLNNFFKRPTEEMGELEFQRESKRARFVM